MKQIRKLRQKLDFKENARKMSINGYAI